MIRESPDLIAVTWTEPPAAVAVALNDPPTAGRYEGQHGDELQLELAELRRRCQNLMVAVETNRRIGMAVGIVMTVRHITDEAAFDLLRQLSQRTHRKLRDIAEDILFTGEIPSPAGTARVASATGHLADR